jgi:hypothetical protein
MPAAQFLRDEMDRESPFRGVLIHVLSVGESSSLKYMHPMYKDNSLLKIQVAATIFFCSDGCLQKCASQAYPA